MPQRERPLNVLGVEADPSVAIAIRTIMEGVLPKDSQIDITPSARDAIQRMKETKYELLFTCYRPVDGRGDEFVRDARNVPGYARIPVIAITAEEGGAVTEAFKTVGVPIVLSKPVDDEELQEAVKASLKKE